MVTKAKPARTPNVGFVSLGCPKARKCKLLYIRQLADPAG